jgi:butyrate kinase
VLGIRENMMAAEYEGPLIDVEQVDSDDNGPLLNPKKSGMRRVRSHANVAAISRNNRKSQVLRKLTRANTFAAQQETEKEKRLKRELEWVQEQEELELEKEDFSEFAEEYDAQLKQHSLVFLLTSTGGVFTWSVICILIVCKTQLGFEQEDLTQQWTT